MVALLFSLAVAAFSQESTTRLMEGIELFRQRRWSEAIWELRLVQTETPSRQLRAEALFWISIAHISAGEYEQALREMQLLERTYPENHRILQLPYHRGRAFFYLGRYNEAVAQFTQYSNAISSDPFGGVLSAADTDSRASSMYWIGESFLALGRTDEAIEIFSNIVTQYPSSAKFNAAAFRLALVYRKSLETELLHLLRWSHEESLRNMEEFSRRELVYEHLARADRMPVADPRFESLGEEVRRLQEELDEAKVRIAFLEAALKVYEDQGYPVDSSALQRLRQLRLAAESVERRILELNNPEEGDTE